MKLKFKVGEKVSFDGKDWMVTELDLVSHLQYKLIGKGFEGEAPIVWANEDEIFPVKYQDVLKAKQINERLMEDLTGQ